MRPEYRPAYAVNAYMAPTFSSTRGQQAEVSKGMRGLVYAVDDTIAHNNTDTHAERMECAQADVEAAAAVDIGNAIPKSLMPTGRRLVYNETANTRDAHEYACLSGINRNNVLTVVLVSTLITIFPASLVMRPRRLASRSLSYLRN